MASLLIVTLLFSSLAFGQQSNRRASADTAVAANANTLFAEYLIEVTGSPETSKSYSKEVASIAKVLTSPSAKNPVLIDEHGYARGMVVEGVAANLASDPNGKRLYRVNWNALFSGTHDQIEFEGLLQGILKYVAGSRDKMVIYLDDIASFSNDSPILGTTAAADLYKALSQGQIQILSAADSLTFDKQIAGDSRLRSRFEKIAIRKSSDDDPFVGDKLSPDLRQLVADAGGNRTVKVILQSDDIDNPQLLNVLKRNHVQIESRAHALNMLTIDLPVQVAEEIASVEGTKHLSLNKEINLLGHVETTTGVSLVRNWPANTVTGTLDGTGIGIAVVDSGVFENHHHFMDASGKDRVIVNQDFVVTTGSSTNKDPYGHGSHVAGLIAGG